MCAAVFAASPSICRASGVALGYAAEKRYIDETQGWGLTRKMKDTREDAEQDPLIVAAIERGICEIKGDRITYNFATKKSYDWDDAEEWVRARTLAFLVLEKGYPLNRMRTEVSVPRRTPGDYADIVVYKDDQCRVPYLVVENKAANQTKRDRLQAIEQLFGNSNSLRAELGLYDEYSESAFYDIAAFPQTERKRNLRGTRAAVPAQYGEVPRFVHIAGQEGDIRPVAPAIVETLIRRAHSIIWSGGKRDPLKSFDEWSKLLFAKVIDEKHTPTGKPRRFQVGTNETTAAVANRIHALFASGVRLDPTIFPDGIRIDLPDRKIFDVVSVLQGISFSGTDVDNIGIAFENFLAPFSGVNLASISRCANWLDLSLRCLILITAISYLIRLVEAEAFYSKRYFKCGIA